VERWNGGTGCRLALTIAPLVRSLAGSCVPSHDVARGSNSRGQVEPFLNVKTRENTRKLAESISPTCLVIRVNSRQFAFKWFPLSPPNLVRN